MQSQVKELNPMDQAILDKMAKNLEEPKKERTLTREQRRFKERIEKEAMARLNALVEKFYEFFMENDPESEAVAAKKKELSAKWKMYVHDRRLNKDAAELFDGAAQKVINKYHAQLKEA